MKSGRILLMRHAEKSADPLDPDLSRAGAKRAQRLASYIADTFGRPDFLFATKRSKHSNRPYETLKPLAKEIGRSIDNGFADQDYGALAHKLFSKGRFEDRTTLICWHHGNIPPLCHALEATHGTYPDPWPSLVFNLILQFDFKDGVAKLTLISDPF